MKKTKSTLFSQTLKVEEKKVPLVFLILALGLRYSNFLLFCQPRQQGGRQKLKTWLYLSPRAKIEKTKGTLFSSTFKV